MKKLNLFQLAQENAKQYDAQLSDLMSTCKPEEKEHLCIFLDWILEEANISINLPAAVLAYFVKYGIWLNIHEWATEQEALSGRAKIDCLRERLGEFYPLRFAFEDAFQDGDHFRYAALNCGGIGFTKKFNSMFCLVIKKNFTEKNDISYLPKDSLSYHDESGKLNISGICHDVAPHSHRHILAAIKHSAKVGKVTGKKLTKVILSDKSYIEAIFATSFSQNDVSEARIIQKDYDKLWNLSFANFGKKIGPAQKALVLDFTIILKSNKNGTLPLKVLT